MAESPKRSKAISPDIEFECSQLTLDDWADALRAFPRPTETPVRGSASSEGAASAVPQKDGEPNSRIETGTTTPHRSSATELLETPDALLTRTHLRELGLERRAVDAVFRTLAVVALPGYSRPMIRVRDFLELLERCTFRDDRVRPIAGAS
jgi:hypothetical protein